MMKFKMSVRPNDETTFMITPDISKEEWNETIGMVVGSFNVFMARLMDLPYPEFLRMCRDKYGATLSGNTGWTTPVWSKDSNYAPLLIELNTRLAKISRKD